MHTELVVYVDFVTDDGLGIVFWVRFSHPITEMS